MSSERWDLTVEGSGRARVSLPQVGPEHQRPNTEELEAFQDVGRRLPRPPRFRRWASGGHLSGVPGL